MPHTKMPENACCRACDLAPDRIRDRRVPRLEAAARAGHVDDVNVDEAAGIRDRQRAQPYRVHDLEQCGVRADAQRQGHDGDDRKAAIALKTRIA